MKGIPNSFYLFGINVKFYGVLMALAMLVGVLLACKNTKFRGMISDNIFTLALIVLPLAVIGARLFYVLGASHSYTFWEIFKIWEGGLSIYGGLIGGAVGVAIFCFFMKKNFFDVADICVVSLILGQAIGRWGNFFNQEVYGKLVTNPAWQWFPFAVYLDNCEWHYALFFYEFLLNLAIFAVLYVMLKKIKQRGYVMSAYLVLYGAVRFVLEPLRAQEYNLMLLGIKLSSLVSAIAVVAGIIAFVLIYTKSKRGRNIEQG